MIRPLLTLSLVLLTFVSAIEPSFALKLPDGYEVSIDDGVETINQSAEIFKSVLTGILAALIIIGFVFAVVLRAVPSREWKEKGKAILVDNVGTILLVLVGLPALLSILKLVNL